MQANKLTDQERALMNTTLGNWSNIGVITAPQDEWKNSSTIPPQTKATFGDELAALEVYSMSNLKTIEDNLQKIADRKPATFLSILLAVVGTGIAAVALAYTFTRGEHDALKNDISALSDAKYEAVSANFRTVDARFDQVSQRLNDLGRQSDSIENHSVDNGKSISRIEGSLLLITDILRKEKPER